MRTPPKVIHSLSTSTTYSILLSVLLHVRGNLLFLLRKNRKKKFFLFQTLTGPLYPQVIHSVYTDLSTVQLSCCFRKTFLSTVFSQVIHSLRTANTQSYPLYTVCKRVYTVTSYTVVYTVYTIHRLYTVLHNCYTANTQSLYTVYTQPYTVVSKWHTHQYYICG
jgi:hypothetical protein